MLGFRGVGFGFWAHCLGLVFRMFGAFRIE